MKICIKMWTKMHFRSHFYAKFRASVTLVYLFGFSWKICQGVGSKGQTIYFCESSHVAYQIKGNWSQSTMKANMLSLHTPTTPGVGSKVIHHFGKCLLIFELRRGQCSAQNQAQVNHCCFLFLNQTYVVGTQMNSLNVMMVHLSNKEC